jgi:hypothetical protein
MSRAFYIVYRIAAMFVSLLSRFINAAFLGGSTHQTTSARAYVEDWGFGRRLINVLFFWEEDHCKKAWENEVREAKKILKRARID